MASYLTATAMFYANTGFLMSLFGCDNTAECNCGSLHYLMKRFGPPLQKGTILCLDAVYCAGMWAPSVIPSIVTRTSLFALSCSSLLTIDFQIDLAKKSIVDVKHANITGTTAVMIAGALKTTCISMDMLLGITGFVAATAGLFKEAGFQQMLYKGMTPFSWGSIAIQVVITFWYLDFFRRVLSNTNNMPEALPVLDIENLRLHPEQQEAVKTLATQVRFCMDKDTLADLMSQIEDDRIQELSQIAEDNIHTQRTVAWGGGIILDLIGYFFLFIEKWVTINSKWGALINLFMAILYALNVVGRFGCEVKQRNRIFAAPAAAPLGAGTREESPRQDLPPADLLHFGMAV